MKYTANLIGATGLVGSRLLEILIEDERFSQINVFARRPTGLSHPKLQEKIVDFDKPELWANLVTGEIAFSALGTTLKKAGSKAAQYKVDFSYQYQFAEVAAKNGIPKFVLVSSAGANAKSSMFYPRIKGELDTAVANLSFQDLTILRPSILDGNRIEKRTAEKISIRVMKTVSRIVFKKYRPIKDETVAKAMINAAINGNEGKQIIELDEIFSLAGY